MTVSLAMMVYVMRIDEEGEALLCAYAPDAAMRGQYTACGAQRLCESFVQQGGGGMICAACTGRKKCSVNRLNRLNKQSGNQPGLKK